MNMIKKSKVQKKVLTEDLGKIFEMSICLLYKTDYVGKYKYSLKEACKIKNKMIKLKTVFPFQLKHIAQNRNRYDFVTVDRKTYLSAKTTKKDGKVCPQVIGQISKKKFSETFGLGLITDNERIKKYIMDNILILLNAYSSNTFDCPILYYNKHKDKILFVKLLKDINWVKYNVNFSHVAKDKEWNESSSIIVNSVTIGEFQIHNNRDCVKFRWSFEKILSLFDENFEIIKIL